MSISDERLRSFSSRFNAAFAQGWILDAQQARKLYPASRAALYDAAHSGRLPHFQVGDSIFWFADVFGRESGDAHTLMTDVNAFNEEYALGEAYSDAEILDGFTEERPEVLELVVNRKRVRLITGKARQTFYYAAKRYPEAAPGVQFGRYWYTRLRWLKET